MSTFEDILATDGILVYKTRGRSMEPLLRQGRDLVTVRRPEGPLKRFDVALYRRGDRYVLHRVIKTAEDHYMIRGDNTYLLENVPCKAVIGVMTGFKRKGREVDASNRLYGLYTRFWNGIYPLRFVCFLLVRGLKAAARKLGITPLIKRMIRHE